MKELFYSPSDKKLFYISGYESCGYSVKEIVSMLENRKDYFLRQIKFPHNTVVNTDYITKSSRYKSMRYFWIDNVDKKDIPKGAFNLTAENGWTMQKWIEN